MMPQPYAERAPDPDAQVNPWSYGISEWIDDAELWECAKASGLVPDAPEPQAA